MVREREREKGRERREEKRREGGVKAECNREGRK